MGHLELINTRWHSCFPSNLQFVLSPPNKLRQSRLLLSTYSSFTQTTTTQPTPTPRSSKQEERNPKLYRRFPPYLCEKQHGRQYARSPQDPCHRVIRDTPARGKVGGVVRHRLPMRFLYRLLRRVWPPAQHPATLLRGRNIGYHGCSLPHTGSIHQCPCGQDQGLVPRLQGLICRPFGLERGETCSSGKSHKLSSFWLPLISLNVLFVVAVDLAERGTLARASGFAEWFSRVAG